LEVGNDQKFISVVGIGVCAVFVKVGSAVAVFIVSRAAECGQVSDPGLLPRIGNAVDVGVRAGGECVGLDIGLRICK